MIAIPTDDTSDARILLIPTGGTMDSEPYADPRNPPAMVETLKGEHSLVTATVQRLPNHERVDFFTWGTWQENQFNKDSQKFEPHDIAELAAIIRNDSHQYFILTHGTDAMAKNAVLLDKALKGSGKTVAFVGAMVPLSMDAIHPSDGKDSLRYALEHVAEQPPGVHMVARHEQTRRLNFFDPATVEKNKVESRKNLQFIVNESYGR